MKLLIDTAPFIWASRETSRLSPNAASVLSDPYNERFVSLASVWEIQIKHGLGKLPLDGPADVVCRRWSLALAAELLPIELRHISKLYELGPVHRDPFDRIIVAQALSEGFDLVSPDLALAAYGVSIIW